MSFRNIVPLAVLALILAAGPAAAAPIGADASLACAQSPLDAAVDMANSSITPDDPNVGMDACPKLCQSWLRTCKGAVQLMKSCWLGVIGKVTGLRNATCNVLSSKAAKDSCKAIVKSEQVAAKDFVKLSAETGNGFCEGTGLGNCLLNCS